MTSAAPATLPDDTVWNRFAPAALRRALCTPGAGAVDGSFEAAVLLADVSGFTALASRLAERGAAGPEALSQLLNASFATMLREVHACGGEVERLAGDALLATRGPVMRTWACSLGLRPADSTSATFPCQAATESFGCLASLCATLLQRWHRRHWAKCS